MARSVSSAAMEVELQPDGATLRFRRCPTGPCSHEAFRSLQTPFSRGEGQAGRGRATLDVVETVAGGAWVHARIESAHRGDGRTYEALFSADASTPLFARETSFGGGEMGERKRTALYRRWTGARWVFGYGDVFEDSALCGIPHQPIEAVEWIDGRSPPVSVPLMRVLSEAAHTGRSRADGQGPSASVAPAGAYVQSETLVGRAERIDSVSTLSPAWRRGDATLARSSPLLPIDRIAVASSADGLEGWLLTDHGAWPVRVDGGSSVIRLPMAVRTSCIALVAPSRLTLIGAYAAGDGGWAEAGRWAARLSDDGQADQAAAWFSLAGDRAPALLERHWPALAPRGRLRALSATSSVPCPKRTALLALAFSDDDRTVVRRASDELARCGSDAARVLGEWVRLGDDRMRRYAAPAYARAVGRGALFDLSAVAGLGPTETRKAVRSALGRAASMADVSELRAALARSMPTRSAVDVLHGFGTRLPELEALGWKTWTRAWSDGAFPERFALVDALVRLAQSSPEAAERLHTIAFGDPDPRLRVRAASVLWSRESSDGRPADGGAGTRVAAACLASGTSQSPTGGGLRDPSPRVRAAWVSANGVGGPCGETYLRHLLAISNDPWGFVRARVAHALEAAPSSDAVVAALARLAWDGASTVRTASVEALGHHGRSRRARTVIVDVLTDDGQPSDVRATATHSAVAMCADEARPALRKLAARTTAEGAYALTALGAFEAERRDRTAWSQLVDTAAASGHPVVARAAAETRGRKPVCPVLSERP
jgi:hypothetical protein